METIAAVQANGLVGYIGNVMTVRKEVSLEAAARTAKG